MAGRLGVVIRPSCAVLAPLLLLLAGPAAALELDWEPTQSTPITAYGHFGHTGFELLAVTPPWGDMGQDPRALPYTSGCGAFTEKRVALTTVEGVQDANGSLVPSSRGLAYDMKLDVGAPMQLAWYVAVERLAGAPVVTPRVAVTAEIGESETFVRPGRELLTAASGQSPEAMLQPGAPGHQVIDGLDVYEIRVPMELHREVLEGRNSPLTPIWHLFVEVRMDVPCDHGIQPSIIWSYTGPGARSHLNMTILNAMRWHTLEPEFRGDQVIIHAMADTPWGVGPIEGPWIDAYAMGTGGGGRINMTGPSPAPEWAAVYYPRDDHWPDLHMHGSTVAHVDWIWNLTTHPPRAGTHEVSVAYTGWGDELAAKLSLDPVAAKGEGCRTNYEGRGCFDVLGEPLEREAPGLGLSVALSLAGAMAMRHRRRQRPKSD